MHQPGYYRGKSEQEIASEIGSEGFAPRRVTEAPGSTYDRHRNSSDIVMAFLEGSAEIWIGSRLYKCRPGDRLVINGLIEHSATVGPFGCTYLMTQVPTHAD